MSKAKTLATTVSTGGVLADGTVAAAEVSGLATVATSGAYSDLSGTPAAALPLAGGTMTGAITFAGGQTWPTFNQNTTGTASNVTGTVAVANGGTGATTLTADNVILGDGTSAVKFVAPGANGNVLTSDGTTWTSAAAAGGGGDYKLSVFTSPGTWTKPSGLKAVKVTVIGGGGAALYVPSPVNNSCSAGGGGGAIEEIAAPSIPGPVSVTVGAGGTVVNVPFGPGRAGDPGGTSSFGPFLSATGGSGVGAYGSPTPVSGGLGSGGDINVYGGSGANYIHGYLGGAGALGMGVTTFGGSVARLYGSGGVLTNPTYSPENEGAGGIVIVEEFY